MQGSRIKKYPISCIYVWATFKHQVKGMYANQKFDFSSLRRPELYFWHRAGPPSSRATIEQGHHQAGAMTGSIKLIQNKYITVDGEHQQTVNIKNSENRLIDFHKQSNSYFITNCVKVRLEDAQA